MKDTKMKQYHSYVGYILAVILLLAALAFFGITLAIGTVGIVVATQDNQCQGQLLGESCIQDGVDLMPDKNVTNSEIGLSRFIKDQVGKADYFYWLVGASLSGLVFFCIGGSLSVWTASRIVSKLHQKSNNEGSWSPNNYDELLQVDGGHSENINVNDNYIPYCKEVWMEVEGLERNTDSQKWREYQDSSAREAIRIEDGMYELVSQYDEGLHLKKLSIGAFFGLCFSFLCGISSILCLLWSFAIGFNRTRRVEQTVTPFVVANILSGIVAPVLFFIAVLIFVNIADYFTNHKIEAHLILTRFLPCLKYEVGQDLQHKKHQQWVIADSLVFGIKHGDDDLKRRKCKFCRTFKPNYSTILLSVIVVLSLMISFSFFIDITLVHQVTVPSCTDSNINDEFSCFTSGNLQPVNCISNNSTQRLHCFRFFRFGVDVDLIASSTSAFAFFLFMNKIFTGIILVLRTLKDFTTRQGELFIVAGLMLLLVTVGLTVKWITGYASESVALLAHLDVLVLAQLAMVSLFIMIVGLLARHGRWVERRPARRKLVKFEKDRVFHTSPTQTLSTDV